MLLIAFSLVSYHLIAGETIEKSIRMELTYDEIDNSIDNLWSILFTTGYLTQKGKSKGGIYQLLIPNKEVREVYIIQIQEWFKNTVLNDTKPVKKLLKAFEDGDAKQIEKDLTKILGTTISILDTKARKEEKEIFYHGILLGCLRNHLLILHLTGSAILIHTAVILARSRCWNDHGIKICTELSRFRKIL